MFCYVGTIPHFTLMTFVANTIIFNPTHNHYFIFGLVTTKLVIFREWCSCQAIVVNAGSSPVTVPNSNFTDMENKTIDMNLSIVDAFKKNFPELDIKTPTWAVLGVTAEFRKLQVGDIVLFPIDSYNYQTIRSTPGTSMVPEVLNEGRQWKTKLDRDNKSVAVLRIA